MLLSTGSLVFITGASGFLGAHIVLQLLEAGYRVRAAARGTKIQELSEAYSKYADRFEVINIPNITFDQFPEALYDVSAIVHVAAPVPGGNVSGATILKEVREGTLNIVRQAERAGIKKIVVTSSRASIGGGGSKMYSDQDWNPVTLEQANSSPYFAYALGKTQAERDLWAFAEEHPQLDVTTINPPWIYGPFAQAFRAHPTSISSLSNIYSLLFPDGSYPRDSHYVDVRDVAAAHVKALTISSSPELGRKRLLFASPHDLNLASIRALALQRWPQLASRWTCAVFPSYETLHMPYNFERLNHVLGLTKSDFIPVEDTMLDTIRSLLVAEQEWVERLGYKIKRPSSMSA